MQHALAEFAQPLFLRQSRLRRIQQRDPFQRHAAQLTDGAIELRLQGCETVCIVKTNHHQAVEFCARAQGDQGHTAASSAKRRILDQTPAEISASGFRQVRWSANVGDDQRFLQRHSQRQCRAEVFRCVTLGNTLDVQRCLAQIGHEIRGIPCARGCLHDVGAPGMESLHKLQNRGVDLRFGMRVSQTLRQAEERIRHLQDRVSGAQTSRVVERYGHLPGQSFQHAEGILIEGRFLGAVNIQDAQSLVGDHQRQQRRRLRLRQTALRQVRCIKIGIDRPAVRPGDVGLAGLEHAPQGALSSPLETITPGRQLPPLGRGGRAQYEPRAGFVRQEDRHVGEF